MKFSLLIPTKNRTKLLRRAVKHILNQSYTDFEVVIVDDSQNINDEMNALSSNDSRVKYIWRHGSGIASALNEGLKTASGDLFNQYDDDDFIAGHTLEYVAKHIGDAEWCYGMILKINRYYIPVGKMGRPFDYELEKRQSTIPQPAVFWSRRAFETVGFFDESVDHVADHEYWLKLGANFEPVFFKRIFAYYTVHRNMGTKVFHDLQTKQWHEVNSRYKDVVPQWLKG